MSMKRRLDSLAKSERQNRRAAWEPVQQLAADDLPRAAIGPAARAYRQFSNFEEEERRQAIEEVNEDWKDSDLWDAWAAWSKEFYQAYADAAPGPDVMGVWPQQLPPPPKEPEGMWEHYLEIVQQTDSRPDLERGAAADCLTQLVVARGLRRYVYPNRC